MKKLCCVLMLVFVAGAAGAGEFIIPKVETVDDVLIPDQYIVEFTPGAASGNVHALAAQVAQAHGARTLFVYDALGGAAYRMNENQAREMARNPNVSIVEQDVTFHIVGDQANPPSWGIDRVDQRNLPLSNSYHWDFDGTGVDAYITDTGIRVTHNDFGGRASWGMDCVGVGEIDDHGHGTHVAGTVGSATYGVAKNVNLIAVKVCNSSGSCQGAWTSCGLNFVANQKLANPNQPTVGNYSIGGPFSQTNNNNMADVIATGVFYAVAAGNSNADACNFSPASEPTAFTLGSTTISDARSSFSNFGTCVDIFAPGSSILSTWNTGDTATATISGTSMASPHAAGAGALVLDEHPTWSPAQVSAELVSRGTSGVISGAGAGSPNLLLYTLGDVVPPCTVNADCNDGVGCTDDTCNAGTCSNVANDANCPDNGQFCDGAEFCDAILDCQSTGDPCGAGEVCNESTDTCDVVGGCTLLPKGASCTADSQCCSNKCRGKAGSLTCK